MGRKIHKSKRHKKIKAIDPFYEGDRKKLLERNIGKFDQPPKNVGEQEIPRSLRELMEAQEKMKSGENLGNKRKKKKPKNLNVRKEYFGETETGMEIPLRKVPDFIIQPNETEEMFLERVQRVTNDVIARSKIEDRYGLNDKKKGAEEVFRKRNHPDDPDDYKIKKLRGDGLEKPVKKSQKKLQRKLKLKEKLRKRKDDRIDEFKLLKDVVPFGETVMQPPSIKVAPKKRNTIISIKNR